MKLMVTASRVSMFLLLAGYTLAATLYVASNGLDVASCGSQTGPCRSIGQAISNAAAGDKIIVGPGIYGDLTDNADYNDPGEEQGGASCGGIRGVICVDRALTIESSHGAQATLLRWVAGVRLVANGIVFGGPGKGFTMAMRDMLYFEAGTSGNSVIGNKFLRTIVSIDGSAHIFSQNNSASGGEVFVGGTGQVLRDNVVHDNCGTGFGVSGSGHILTNNLAIGCAIGLDLAGQDHVVRGNSFIGNNYTGVLVGITGSGNSFTGNNIFANSEMDAESGEPSCGFLNRSGATFDARGNYWGTSSGPGPNPADEVCDEEGSTTDTSGFASQPFAFPVPDGGSANSNPACTAAQASPAVLWPANDKFTSVWITGVADPDLDPVSLAITGVTQDELVSSGGGDTGPDAVILGSSADIRAQRLAAGNGRVYKLHFTASDGKGGSCTGAVTVVVPKNQNSNPPVDDGQNYDSTRP